MSETLLNGNQINLGDATGSYVELTLATNMGKTALAEALTGKGAATTTSDTLIQMADKINNLNIDSSTDNLYADTKAKYNTTTSSFSTPLSWFRNWSNGDYILINGNVIYYVPNSATYTSIADMISAATHTVDVSTIDATYAIPTAEPQMRGANTSEDFSKLIVPVKYSGVTFTALVFNVDATNGFTLLHTVADKQMQYQNDCRGIQWCVNNAGTHVAYLKNSNTTFVIYDIVNDTEYSATLATAINYGMMAIMKNSAIYVFGGGTSGTIYWRFWKVPYSIDSSTGAVTFGTEVASETYYGTGGVYGVARWIHVPGQDDVPVLAAEGPLLGKGGATAISTNLYKTTVPVFSMDSAAGFVRQDYLIAKTATVASTNATDNFVNRAPVSLKTWKIKSYTNDTITYSCPLYDGDIIYNRTTNSFSTSKELAIFDTYNYTSSAYMYPFYANDSAVFGPNSAINDHTLNSSSMTFYKYDLSLEHRYLIGKKVHIQDADQYYLPEIKGTSDDSWAAAYIADIQVSPSPEE